MRFLLDLFFCSLVRNRKKPGNHYTGTTTQQPYVCTQSTQSDREQLEAELDAAIYANDEMFLEMLAIHHQVSKPFTPREMNAISLLADRYQAGDFKPQQ